MIGRLRRRLSIAHLGRRPFGASLEQNKRIKQRAIRATRMV
jgi:hypothetical protein